MKARILDTGHTHNAPHLSIRESIGKIGTILKHEPNGFWGNQYLIELPNKALFWFGNTDIELV